MDNNILGIILSFSLIILVATLSTILQKMKLLGDESSRKFIHIGVSNCWIILMIFFDNIYLACIPPAVFILLNYISYKYNLVKSMEREDEKSLGTVYFPISLLILVLITFSLDMTYIGAVGILVLGYGDGMAGLIGKKYGKIKVYKNKSIQGSAAMFVASLIVSFIILSIFTPSIAIVGSLILAILATAIELFTPRDLDNLTVPLGSAAIYYGLIIAGSTATNLFLLAIILNIIVAYVAYKKKSLDLGGTLTAIIVGVIMFVTAGPLTWSMLMLFFISSSLITHIKKSHKAKLSSEYEKTKRGYKQVVATGLIPVLFSIAYFLTKSDIYLLMTISTIAINCADTWASEIGILNKGKTISIVNFKPVKKGASGGISLLGTSMSLLGAALIAISFILIQSISFNSSNQFVIVGLIGITLIGFIGSLIDSLLGAAVQARHIDSKTNKITEARKTNGKLNQKISGIRFVSNNAVNLLSNIIGSAIGLIFFLYLLG